MVAEEPEIHLRPDVEPWCQHDGRLALIGDNTDDPNAYILELEWRGAYRSVGGSAGSCRLPHRLLRRNRDRCPQRRVNGHGSPTNLRLEVGTRELPPDAGFAPHGHVVVIDIAGVH